MSTFLFSRNALLVLVGIFFILISNPDSAAEECPEWAKKKITDYGNLVISACKNYIVKGDEEAYKGYVKSIDNYLEWNIPPSCRDVFNEKDQELSQYQKILASHLQNKQREETEQPKGPDVSCLQEWSRYENCVEERKKEIVRGEKYIKNCWEPQCKKY